MGLMVAVGAATVISVTTVLESVAIVGAVLSVVGTVTKNKTLSTIGMVMGVVGGVGAFASAALGGSAALFSSAGSVAEGAAATGEAAGAAGAAEGVVDAGAFTTEAATGAAPDALGELAAAAPDAAVASAGPSVSDTLGAVSSVGKVATAATASPAPPATPADTIVPGTSGEAGPVASTTGLLDADKTPGTPVPPLTSGLGATDPATGNTITSAVDPTTGKVVDMPDGSSGGISGTFDKLVAYAGKNPVVALGALQAGGSFLTGAFSSLTPAQVTALNAQAAQNDAQAALVRQQTANLNMPKAVAASAPVTGNVPLVAQAQPGGLINQAPQVTGKVAA